MDLVQSMIIPARGVTAHMTRFIVNEVVHLILVSLQGTKGLHPATIMLHSLKKRPAVQATRSAVMEAMLLSPISLTEATITMITMIVKGLSQVKHLALFLVVRQAKATRALCASEKTRGRRTASTRLTGETGLIITAPALAEQAPGSMDAQHISGNPHSAVALAKVVALTTTSIRGSLLLGTTTTTHKEPLIGSPFGWIERLLIFRGIDEKKRLFITVPKWATQPPICLAIAEILSLVTHERLSSQATAKRPHEKAENCPRGPSQTVEVAFLVPAAQGQGRASLVVSRVTYQT